MYLALEYASLCEQFLKNRFCVTNLSVFAVKWLEIRSVRCCYWGWVSTP